MKHAEQNDTVSESPTFLQKLSPLLVQYSDEIANKNLKYAVPLTGGIWGADQRFWFGSVVSTDSLFYAVRYLILERKTGAVIGSGNTKAESLAMARLLFSTCAGDIDPFLAQINHQRNVLQRERDAKVLEFVRRRESAKKPQVTNRRLNVFSKTNGVCYYCACDIDLHGDWHIEHMVPRSKGGPDTLNNLVPACAPCNHAKYTMTAEEFLAKLAAA